MKKSDVFWQTYLMLEKELLEVSKYIYITDEKIIKHKTESCTSQLETFSPHIADLIIRTCIEIEALSKELYFDFGGTKKRGDKDLFFDEDCLKEIDIKCKTHKKVVIVTSPLFNLTKNENKIFKPLKEAHKRQGTDWERAYQALKHDRYSSLSFATIKNLLHSLGALYLLNIYYRDIKLHSKYLEVSNLDLSLGSSIFSVKSPNQNYVVDVINGNEIADNLIADDSPFVLKYTDSMYKEILDANVQSAQKRKSFLLVQPELSDPDFLRLVENGVNKEKENPSKRFIFSWELCKYRLNKKIPSTLPFEERKKLFISSSEWNGRIRMANKHLSEDELNESNIQSEIDSAGTLAGMEMEQQFEYIKMQKAFNEGYCELVLDKGNIRYIK